MINKDTTIEELNAINKNTLMEAIGIEYIEIKEGYVKAKMPIDNRTLQPTGILHGGASLAMAETIGGIGSAIMVDLSKNEIRGSGLNANHVGSARGKFVLGEATIIHQGKNTHVWNIDIKDENNHLVSTCRLTNFILKK